MKPQLRHIKTEIITPNDPPIQRPATLVCDRIDEPHYIKLIPLGMLITIIIGVIAVLYMGYQVSMESHRATVAQAQAIEKQAEAIERQTAIIEGMAERRQTRTPNSEEVKNLMIFLAIVLGVLAAIKCAFND